MRIAFIGFGEAARAFAGTLREKPGLDFVAYDILIGTPRETALVAAAGALGVTLAPDPNSAVVGADWIVSAVTAEASLAAAASVADDLETGQVYLDINSVSAGRKIDTARLIGGKGGRYLDMAVMAPVHPRGHRTPALIAGPHAEALAGALGALDFDFEFVGADVGAATSVKMVRSLFVKGLEAITLQALLAAKAAGCHERILASLAGSYPRLDWPRFADYQLERVTTHGVRRAAEMRESAVTMQELGFAAGADLARAIAAVQHEIGSLDAHRAAGELLPDALAGVLALRQSKKSL